MDREEYKIKRAIAIKQYRFLQKMIKLGRERRQYSLVASWRIEANQLKAQYNL